MRFCVRIIGEVLERRYRIHFLVVDILPVADIDFLRVRLLRHMRKMRAHIKGVAGYV
jgi:hypothetical protein